MRRFLASGAALAILAAGALAVATPASASTVLNPGPFTMHLTNAQVQIGIFGCCFAIPVGSSQIAGQIDGSGNVTIPGSSFQLQSIPFDTTQDMQGYLVHAFGSVSLSSTGLSGTLDPSTGAASLTGGVYGTVAVTATTTILAVPLTLYSGVCNFGSAPSPISLTLATDPPGVPYSQATGAMTLESGFTAPSLQNCTPAVDPLYAFVLNTFAGQGFISLAGTTDPVLTGPASGQTSQTGTQTVTANVGAPVITMSVPSSVAFPSLFPGQTSAPISAPVTVTTNDPAGYQFTVLRTAFSGGDIPLSIGSDPPSDAQMVLDIFGLTPIPVGASSTDALVVGHRSGSPSQPNGDVWPTSLILGPVPNVPPGDHTATLTYTVIGF